MFYFGNRKFTFHLFVFVLFSNSFISIQNTYASISTFTSFDTFTEPSISLLNYKPLQFSLSENTHKFSHAAQYTFAARKDPKERRSWLYSTLLPGLGQFYNKKYWKIPILYTLLTSLTIGILYFNNLYFESRKIFFQQVIQGRNDWSKEGYDHEYLRGYTLEARSNRDILITILAVIYVINILDAHVDTHLSTFDTSDNIDSDTMTSKSNYIPQMKLQPSMQPLGCKLSIFIK